MIRYREICIGIKLKFQMIPVSTMALLFNLKSNKRLLLIFNSKSVIIIRLHRELDLTNLMVIMHLIILLIIMNRIVSFAKRLWKRLGSQIYRVQTSKIVRPKDTILAVVAKEINKN